MSADPLQRKDCGLRMRQGDVHPGHGRDRRADPRFSPGASLGDRRMGPQPEPNARTQYNGERVFESRRGLLTVFNASHHNGRVESGPVGFDVMGPGDGRHMAAMRTSDRETQAHQDLRAIRYRADEVMPRVAIANASWITPR